MKRILITGANSYIGTSFEKWVTEPRFEGQYQVDTVDMRGEAWKQTDFSGYDTVFHVAGIAHADIGKVTAEQKALYYRVNCDLAVETAKKAKKSGVRQFIYMSSIIIYGEGTSVRKKRVITRETKPSPSNFYGDSKWKAEQKLVPLSDEKKRGFQVAILRPPMIYGEGCRGNYQKLRKFALRVPVFPDFPNERSMLYIGNLCEFVRKLIELGEGGLYFPQNREYVKTAEMVRIIAQIHDKRIYLIKCFNPVLYFFSKNDGRVGRMMNKAFGNLVYDKMLSDDEKRIGDYQINSLKHSLGLTEK